MALTLTWSCQLNITHSEVNTDLQINTTEVHWITKLTMPFEMVVLRISVSNPFTMFVLYYKHLYLKMPWYLCQSSKKLFESI